MDIGDEANLIDRERVKDTDSAMMDIIHEKKDGGVITWMRGYLYPYYGFPVISTVEAIASVKGMIPTIVKVCFTRSGKFFIGMAFFFRKTLTKFVNEGIDSFIAYAYRILKSKFINPKKFSKSVREIYRVMTLMAERERGEGMKIKISNLRDIICLVLENDNAYRLRLQDIMSEVDIKQIKLDKADKYYCKLREDYNFSNLTPTTMEEKTEQINERLVSRKLVVEQKFDKLVDEKNKIIEQSKQMQTRINEIDSEVLRLQGRFAEIKEESEHLEGIKKNEEKAKEIAEPKEIKK